MLWPPPHPSASRRKTQTLHDGMSCLPHPFHLQSSNPYGHTWIACWISPWMPAPHGASSLPLGSILISRGTSVFCTCKWLLTCTCSLLHNCGTSALHCITLDWTIALCCTVERGMVPNKKLSSGCFGPKIGYWNSHTQDSLFAIRARKHISQQYPLFYLWIAYSTQEKAPVLGG